MTHRLTPVRASILGALFLTGPAFGSDCAPDRVDLRGDWGQARFSVEVADDPRERALGLMHREEMPLTHGMLFMFEEPQDVSFWMKNTLIPLDMLFLSKDGTVSRIHENAVPQDLTPIHGGTDILAVLEVNGGVSARFAITEGSELRHPAFDQSVAIWACDSAN